MSKYKTLTTNFIMNDERDSKLYKWLQSKRGKGNFIKDTLEEKMNSENNNYNKLNNCKLDAREIDDKFSI